MFRRKQYATIAEEQPKYPLPDSYRYKNPVFIVRVLFFVLYCAH